MDVRPAQELEFDREGTRLAGVDFGGDGSPVLLLHGLAGYAGEWAETADWLAERARVVALDARGHGASERLPADVSRSAHVEDAIFAIEQLGLQEVVVVGQSLGGLTAMRIAAERPDLVRGLVVVEAGPGDGDAKRAEEIVSGARDALRGWPRPFPSREEAVEFFGERGMSGEVWADGLQRRDGGLWPRFDVDLLARTLREAVAHSYWGPWERSTCRALVEVEGAGHDVHLDKPVEWRRALTEFLDSL